MKRVVAQAHLNQQLNQPKEDQDDLMIELNKKKPYLDYQGVLGEVYASNVPEFAPQRLSKAEEFQKLNKVLDKLHAYLQEVPQVDELPIMSKQSRLYRSMDFLRSELA